jgi:hypothetical protein
MKFSVEQIQSLFGEAAVEYLKNKNRGGVNSEKGNTYENFYVLYQLAVLSRDWIESGQDTLLSSQVLAFVDDLVIDRLDNRALCNFQLKNSSNVSWGEGEKSIQDDFSKQKSLNDSVSRESELYLVVADDKLCSRLGDSCPAAIRSFSEVLYFPYEKSLGLLLDSCSSLRRAIQYICAFEEPETDKIECVAGVLLGAIVSSDKTRLSVKEILEKASNCSPSYIRSFGEEIYLEPAVTEVLSNIADFTFHVSRGFLHWEYRNGTLAGTVSYRVGSEQFKQVERLYDSEILPVN